ncbi:MAG: glutaredoxin family protein [Pseudomonadota bacterium]
MQQVILFGTDGCHLCEMALELVKEAQNLIPLSVEEVDIAHDDALVERYGIRIPVVMRDGRELNWPFDHGALMEFLTSVPEREHKQ